MGAVARGVPAAVLPGAVREASHRTALAVRFAARDSASHSGVRHPDSDSIAAPCEQAALAAARPSAARSLYWAARRRERAAVPRSAPARPEEAARRGRDRGAAGKAVCGAERWERAREEPDEGAAQKRSASERTRKRAVDENGAPPAHRRTIRTWEARAPNRCSPSDSRRCASRPKRARIGGQGSTPNGRPPAEPSGRSETRSTPRESRSAKSNRRPWQAPSGPT